MDEITLFTELQPTPPEDAGRLIEGARARLAHAFGDGAEQKAPLPRWRRARPSRRTMLLMACAVAVAVGAAIVVPVVLPGGGGGSLVTAAWAVQRNPNGTIKVTMKEARDAAGLQAALKKDGIEAYIEYVPWVSKPNGPVTQYPAEFCHSATIYPIVPGKVVEKVFPFPAGGAPNEGYAVTINPKAIPPGDAVLIQVVWTPGRPDLGIDVEDTVLADHLRPVCTPQG